MEKQYKDKLSDEDRLALDNFALRDQLYQLRCDAINSEIARFRAERDAHSAVLRERYGFEDGDQLDVSTGAITRAPKPEPKAEEEVKAEKPKKTRVKGTVH